MHRVSHGHFFYLYIVFLFFFFFFHLLYDNSVHLVRPAPNYYFPTLHHLKFEVEDGTTPNARPVRFGFNPGEFPDFSWRGYAVMSPAQVNICPSSSCIALKYTEISVAVNDIFKGFFFTSVVHLLFSAFH